MAKKFLLKSKMILDLYRLYSHDESLPWRCLSYSQVLDQWMITSINPRVITMHISSEHYLGYEQFSNRYEITFAMSSKRYKLVVAI